MINKIILSVLFFSLFSGVAVAQEDPRDITPPVISNVDIFMTSAVNVSVTWRTNEISTSVVRYGVTSDYGYFGYGENSTNHIINLDDLDEGKEYFFEIISADESGNESVVSGISFSMEEYCAFPPAINFFTIEPEITSATFEWETDIVSSYNLEYGKSGEGPMEQISQDELQKKHNLLVEGLEASVEYFVTIVSTNELGLSSESATYYFHTLDDDGGGGSTGDDGDTEEQPVSGGGHSHAGEVVKEVPCEDDVTAPISVTDLTSPNKVQGVTAVSLDSVISLNWTLPSNKDYSKIKIIRNDKNYPKDLNDGFIVYDGTDEKVNDTNLINGKTYYYAIYSYNSVNNFMEPILFSLAPYNETRHIHILSVSNFNLYDFSDILKNNLKLGDKSDEVGHLQELLATDPNVYQEGLVTNYFGPLTEKAVKKIQEKFGLPISGQLDEKTRESVISNSVKQKIVERTDIPEISFLSSNISIGMKGKNISYLQSYLITKGYLKEGLSTGYFGEMTKQAIVDFQKKNNISPASGYVGPKTRAKILEDIKITDYLK